MAHTEKVDTTANGSSWSPLIADRDRVSEATGPNREIDRLIAVAVGGFVIDGESYGEPRYCRVMAEGGLSCPGNGSGDWMVPRYSESLDAALTLVAEKLPGWTTNVHTADVSPDTYPIRTTIILHEDGDAEVTLQYCHPKVEAIQVGYGASKTAPLAVLGALLTALIEIHEARPAPDASQAESTNQTPSTTDAGQADGGT